jgi:hypothetical protein
MADDTPNDARHEVLAENTAQDVQKYLSKLFQEEARFRSRWVWELLQNARDAAPEQGVSVRLIQQPQHLLFRHNGLPFTFKSVAHLIYHGSTKYNPFDGTPIGQFGTGFLTTHLISKTVTVTGSMNDGRRFRFLLDRRGDNADELKGAMDGSWDAFNSSLGDTALAPTDGFTTEYDYPLTGTVVDVVSEGIVDLVTNAAYLLAFNTRIRSLHVQQPDRTVTIEKQSYTPLGNMGKRFHIDERLVGSEPMARYVAALNNDDNTVAIEIMDAHGTWAVAETQRTPRIFVAFPLTATRDFCLPVVINNDKFQPREDRDSLFLKANREGKHPNMVRMEGACALAARLSLLAADETWAGAATLARLSPLGQWDWVDADWFRALLAEQFIQPLRGANVMTTAAGERIPPAGGMIPVADTHALCGDLWDLAKQLSALSHRVPRRDEAHVWADTLTSWAFFLQQPVEHLAESLTLAKLCERVAASETAAELAKQLASGADAIEWLNELHVFIGKANRTELFEQARLIPSQSGALKKITELRRDPGIDEDLKDIAESLGVGIRAELLDRRMRLRELLDLQPKTQGEVVTAAVQKFKERAKGKPLDPDIGLIAVRFFARLVSHDESDRLDGFPVLTRATTAEDPALATLFRDPAKPDERPLAPTGCWPQAARLVADVFPKGQTLSDAYRVALPDDTLWTRTAEEGYLRLSPLYQARRRGIPFIPDEPLPVPEKDKKLKHRTKEAVDVSALAFFDKEETGLDAVRRSKARAIGLLLFLANYVLKVDAGALDAVAAGCDCGETHRHYRAAWLVPMWERRWVPLGEGKQSSATAESIAQLFSGQDEELRQLAAGNGRRLLEALNISVADLSLRAVAKDEETRISLIDSLTDIVRAVDNDLEKVRLVADEIKESPSLVDEIREHRERREKVRRNQTLGAEVERLLRDVLQEYGLKVTRTGVGSDYEVEEDYVVDGKEVFLSVEGGRQSCLIEVKATVSKVARMTVTQARTAVGNQHRFILCVVRLDSSEATPEMVRERCRFVMDIGHQIEPVWEEYGRYQETKGEACTRVGEVELVVSDSQVRFAVGEGAWAGGRSLTDAVAQILRVCRGESVALPVPPPAAE